MLQHVLPILFGESLVGDDIFVERSPVDNPTGQLASSGGDIKPSAYHSMSTVHPVAAAALWKIGSTLSFNTASSFIVGERILNRPSEKSGIRFDALPASKITPGCSPPFRDAVEVVPRLNMPAQWHRTHSFLSTAR